MSKFVECSRHEEVGMVRCEPCAWWYCPVPGCTLILPDEPLIVGERLAQRRGGCGNGCPVMTAPSPPLHYPTHFSEEDW